MCEFPRRFVSATTVLTPLHPVFGDARALASGAAGSWHAAATRRGLPHAILLHPGDDRCGHGGRTAATCSSFRGLENRRGALPDDRPARTVELAIGGRDRLSRDRDLTRMNTCDLIESRDILLFFGGKLGAICPIEFQALQYEICER
jgi:hypothetical protein